MIAPTHERAPIDIVRQLAFQAEEAALHIVDQRAVVGQHEELLLRVEVIQEAQTVEQDQCLAAARDAVDDVQAEVIRQAFPFRLQVQIGFHGRFLAVIQQVVGQASLNTALDRQAHRHVFRDHHFGCESLAQLFELQRVQRMLGQVILPMQMPVFLQQLFAGPARRLSLDSEGRL